MEKQPSACVLTQDLSQTWGLCCSKDLFYVQNPFLPSWITCFQDLGMCQPGVCGPETIEKQDLSKTIESQIAMQNTEKQTLTAPWPCKELIKQKGQESIF